MMKRKVTEFEMEEGSMVTWLRERSKGDSLGFNQKWNRSRRERARREEEGSSGKRVEATDGV